MVLDAIRRKVWDFVKDCGLAEEMIEVISARPLSVDEAIGKPDRSDFPLLRGKEVMMEAGFRSGRGQAFTSMPGEFRGTLKEALTRPLNTDFDRALVVATTNAFLRHLKIVQGTVHCRDEGPRECATRLVDYMMLRFGSPRVAVIGLQPALVEALARRLEVRVTDLDPENVGQIRAGVRVEGIESTTEVIDWADVILATGTVLVNDSIDDILSSKPVVFYGVTIACAAALLGYERYCPCSL